MWLVYEGSKKTSGFKVLELVLALGVPLQIGRVGRTVWGVEYDSENRAEDALWVLRRQSAFSQKLMGEGEWVLTDSPPTFTHVQRVKGMRAEA